MLQKRVGGYEENLAKLGGMEHAQVVVKKPSGKERESMQVTANVSLDVWKTCPKCGILVKKLSRHIRRVHGLKGRDDILVVPRDIKKCHDVLITRQKTKYNSYSCPHCGLSFSKKYKLNTHIELVHPGVDITIRGMDATRAEEMKRRDQERMREKEKERARDQEMKARGGSGVLG